MTKQKLCVTTIIVVLAATTVAWAASPAPDWFEPMKKINQGFDGNSCYIAQFGDSITYSMAFWSPVGWMEPDTFLTGDDGFPKRPEKRWRDTIKGIRNKGPEHGCYSGWTVNQLLESVPAVLQRENPEAAIIMIGTNDTGPGGPPADYREKLERLLRMILEAHCIPILNTIPPKRGAEAGVEKANLIIRELANKLHLPLVDYHAEIMRRQPGQAWDGTLIDKDGVHPTGNDNGNFSEANLSVSGYALRTWLNFRVVRELYFRILSAPKAAAGQAATVEPVRVGLRCDVIADTEVSAYSDASTDETAWNWGAANRLKCKGREEYTLLKFDTSKCRGLTIKRATLYLSRTEQCVIHVAGVSTISTDWQEGKGQGSPGKLPRAQQGRDSRGGATFSHAMYPEKLWAGPGSSFKSVAFGHGGSLWGACATAAAKNEAGQLYFSADLPLEIAQALLVEEDSYGLAVSDEKGQRQFQPAYGRTSEANHFLNSRESRKPCFLIIEGEKAAAKAPAPVSQPETKLGTEPGEVLLTWTCPADARGGKVLGYRVHVAREKLTAASLTPANRLPRCATWRPGAPGEKQEFLVSGLEPGADYSFAVVAYDRTGNSSEPALFTGQARAARPARLAPVAAAMAPGSALETAALRVWACASGEKINPLNGNSLSEGQYLQAAATGNYRNGNDVWDGKRQTVTLFAGRNDFVGFQLAFENRGEPSLQGIEVSGSDLKPTGQLGGEATTARAIAATNIEFFWEWSLKDKSGAWYADPLVPLSGPIEIPSVLNRVPGQKVQALYVDVWVPHNTPPGTYRGEVRIKASGIADVVVPLELTVWSFALPDRLGFVCDMNGYGYPPAKDWEGCLNLHRLAHRNRLNVNLVPYSHSANWTVPQMALEVTGKAKAMRVVSFDQFDRCFGPLLDGRAFAANPRAGVPVPAFYLGLFENWPCRLADGFKFDRSAAHLDIRQDFTQEYKDGFVAVCRQMADHFKQRGYDRTAFQVFLNNKYQYAPEKTFWLLDEPMFRDDFLVLQLFGDLVREGFKGCDPVTVDYRIDCSRVEEARGLMSKVDTMVFSQGNVREYGGIAREFMRSYDPQQPGAARKGWEYGGAGAVTSSPASLRGWVLETWLEGRDGLLPWLAYGTDASWNSVEAATEAVFYPAAKKWGYNGCYGSLRMKAFRDGQQDAECLALLAAKLGLTRRELKTLLDQQLQLKTPARTIASEARPAGSGRISYRGLPPDAFCALRRLLGHNLNQ
jgi:lysophospholipase L1-like esterase